MNKKTSNAKGCKWSDESRRKLSLSKMGNSFALGFKHSDETKTRLSLANIGKHHSLETRNKMSESKSGKKHPLYGKHLSEEHKKKISFTKTGKHHTEETKMKIQFASNNMSVEWKQKIKNARKRQVLPVKDTLPEKMMQIALSLNGIQFIKHKPIKIGNSYHQVDIFINPNICIEVDGDYWHTLPKTMKRDIEINHELNKQGYNIIRIWEKDIKNNTQNCAEKIIELIKTLHPIFKEGEIF